MAYFAKDCCKRLKSVTTKLEVELGPETSNLGFRFGLHSGPVTGGVLRGQRARFQLFGDTVNTASRMENQSAVGQVNISQDTYELLKANPDFSFEKRGKIEVKGKGMMEMYFVKKK